MNKYHQPWRRLVAAALSDLAASSGGPAVDPDSLVVETPPRPDMGDIAFPMFPFAKLLRKGPPVIAGEVARRITARPSSTSTGSKAARSRI